MEEKKLFDLKIGQGHQLLLALQNAGVTAAQAQQIIDDPEYAKKWIENLPKLIADRFAKYAKFIFPVAKQAPVLRELNKRVPTKYQIADSKFDNLDVSSDHAQRYEDFEVLFISLGDFHKTQKLIRWQTKISHGICLSN